MELEAASRIKVTLPLISMLMLVFSVGLVIAFGPNCVMADGSFGSSNSPVSSDDARGGVETLLGIHDIAVTNIRLPRTVVGQGYNVSINVTLANQGNYPETFNVTLHGKTAGIVDIDSNSTVSNFEFKINNIEIGFSVTGPSGTLGFCNVTIPRDLMIGEPWLIFVDGVPTDIVVSGNETHTFLYFTYTHSTHNVVVRGTWVSSKYGPWIAPEFRMTIQTILITLPIGNSTTLTFAWNTTDVPYGNYTISSYADPVSGETDTADNTLSDGWVVVTIAGDVDGDGYVDVDDVFLHASPAYGTEGPPKKYPAHPRYNPNCDFDRDGDVDADDVFTHLAPNYGKSAV